MPQGGAVLKSAGTDGQHAVFDGQTLQPGIVHKSSVGSPVLHPFFHACSQGDALQGGAVRKGIAADAAHFIRNVHIAKLGIPESLISQRRQCGRKICGMKLGAIFERGVSDTLNPLRQCDGLQPLAV